MPPLDDGSDGQDTDSGVVREWPKRVSSKPQSRPPFGKPRSTATPDTGFVIQPPPGNRPTFTEKQIEPVASPAIITTENTPDSDLEGLVRGDPEAINRLIEKARASHHQNQWGLNEPQMRAVELIGGSQRHTLLVGGARSSKTTLFVRGVLVRTIKGQRDGHGGRHAILRQRFNAVKTSVWMDTFQKVQRLFFRDRKTGRVPLKIRPNWQDGFVRVWANPKLDPAEIWFGGLDDQERVEKILGKEYVTLFFNECSQISRQSVIVALTRLAQVIPGLTQKAFYDLNPVGKAHWTYQVFFDKRDPDTRRPILDPDNYKALFLNPLDNAENLTPEYLKELMALPERQRRRFFAGEYVAELANALWSYETLESLRITLEDKPPSKRVVIAIDPSGCEGPEDKRSDEVGLIAAERAMDEQAYVLADESGWYSPEDWAHKALVMRDRWDADCIVAERNYGGDMVRAVIQTKDRNANVKLVNASRGKHVRAEPVAALYDQKKVHHVGRFDRLEEEMTNFTTAGYEGPKSPDRADALVWALTELMLNRPGDTAFGTVQGLH